MQLYPTDRKEPHPDRGSELGEEASGAMASRVSMLAAERRQEIIKAIRTYGRIEVADAAAKFDTSLETIRKDLIALEAQGLLRRVHGGALHVENMIFEQDIASRVRENYDEKRRITVRALAELPSSGAVLLDAGSTIQMLAEMLPARRDLHIFTNSLVVAQAVASRPPLVCHTLGGRVRSRTMAEVGATARRSLQDLHFDIAFVGTNAVSIRRGLSTPDPDEAAIKRDMITNSDRVVLLTDHTKFAQNSLVRYADLTEIDLVITGIELEESYRTALADAGVETELA